MACRKNADRGLTDMSEHLEKQRAQTARQQRQFEEEQRKVWTPPSQLEKCCLQWLAFGPHQMVLNGPSLASTKSRGCSGCSKEHPKVVLNFEDGVATASISHHFDTLVNFFDQLPDASQTNPLKYQLAGLLSNHYESLKHKFGGHLISVDPKALSASQRASERQLEQADLDRAIKRRRVLGAAAPTSLLESAVEICYNHSLGDLLDVADIAWLRTSSKTLGKVASRLARDRMGKIALLYRPFVPKYTSTGSYDGVERLSYWPLRRSTDADTFCPEERTPIPWEHRIPIVGTVGIEIFLEQSSLAVAERNVLFEKDSHLLEVARYYIDVENDSEESVLQARSNVQNYGDEGSLTYFSNGVSRTEGMGGCREITLQSIHFSFTDYLGLYLRKRLYQSKKEYNSSRIKKPSDKAYIKALAQAAREAPGNADSFRSMEGWKHVYR